MTRSEIQKASDERRGKKAATYKLPKRTVAHFKAACKRTMTPQCEILTAMMNEYAYENHPLWDET